MGSPVNKVIPNEMLQAESLPEPSHARLMDVLNKLDQGVMVWTEDGHCQVFNERLLTLLELQNGDIYPGYSRAAFFATAVRLGHVTEDSAKQAEQDFSSDKERFSATRRMPSGRRLQIDTRRLSTGGFVTCYTDVTQIERSARDLTQARQAAEEAELTALKTLAAEQSWREEAKLLSQLDEWLHSCKSQEELFRIVSAFMAQLFPQSRGELYIYSNSRDVLDGKCHWGGGEAHDHIFPDACWALRRGRQYLYSADKIAFACAHVEEQPSTSDHKEYVCFPVVAHGNTVGLLHVKFAPETDAKRKVALHRLALRCGEHISLAVANVRLRDELHDQSTRDPLTGVYNRRYFLGELRNAVALADRRASQVGLLSFDADRFKTFNDTHGHDAGDMVLRAIGDTLKELFHNGEVCCRMGGEEFAVFLPDTDKEQTIEVGEALRAAIEDITLRYGSGTLPRVTISIGVASYPEDGLLPQDLMHAADRALYAAKDAGRNCVVDCQKADPAKGPFSGAQD
ncbi:diguanylate cyclase (GGDEF) -like protein [Phaeobacter inhibens]|uniref:diguanylate cyclase n=2 Tax=Phaeobacter TaxID=302485 RepID=A0ABM6RAV7_9RHOB|nr:diguanylate cyclase (GGDEF) -like protein [Phaeobacter inhibens]AUQ93495.1 diguanylate cyclase (GGDEF) -like protein [Phaeobacter inhibens]AUR18798.1 diguanylate cyclase (GGDEF) -like protein [Phaeobacter inhibens]MBQ4809227.1 diguanylate cyclase [Phaeobacter sp. HS012]MBQ4884067.1 diguanylate cyclase [Phaeobacter sp. HS011]